MAFTTSIYPDDPSNTRSTPVPDRRGNHRSGVVFRTVKLIQLSQGHETIVDDDDYEELSQFKWYASWNRSDRTWRARRNVKKGLLELMHRRILGLGNGQIDKRQVDHINHNSLDNRRCNLRIASHSENQHNRTVQRNTIGGLKGISKIPNSNRWRAQISVNGINKHLGCFLTKEAAHSAYFKSASKLHGDFACP